MTNCRNCGLWMKVSGDGSGGRVGSRGLMVFRVPLSELNRVMAVMVIDLSLRFDGKDSRLVNLRIHLRLLFFGRQGQGESKAKRGHNNRPERTKKEGYIYSMNLLVCFILRHKE